MGLSPPLGAAQSPAAWQDLPVGSFTGVHWANTASMAQADPYLAWAETAGFAGFRSGLGGSATPDWLPLLIELSEGMSVPDLLRAASHQWLQVPQMYLQWPEGLRYCTARVRRGFFDALQPGRALHGLVARYELGLPVGRHAQALPPAACAGHPAAQAIPQVVQGPVMVIIDDGLALGHPDFRDSQGQTRVVAYWRQEDGHGQAWWARDINAALRANTHAGRLDEDGLYQQLNMPDMRHSLHHGTHVASLAVGRRVMAQTLGTEDAPPDWRLANDRASHCPLVVVALDRASVDDTSGGALCVSVTDALAFALCCCGDGARVAVNVSWGAQAGAHNGSSLLERAMAALATSRPMAVRLLVPAGNSTQARAHAQAGLAPGEALTLNWRTQPDDTSQSFLELWMEPQGNASLPLKDLTVQVTPPGATQPLPALGMGQAGVWPDAVQPQCGVMFPIRCALGHPGTLALVATVPTASADPNVPLTRPGVWQVTLRNAGTATVLVDAYVERDDVALGGRTGARPSYLEHLDYDLSGGLQGFVDQPLSPSTVRRLGAFNDLATGTRSISVGGRRHFGSAADPLARYSPRPPTPENRRRQRRGVTIGPDCLAVTDEHAALWGVRAAGTRSAAVARLVGTSAGTPQLARRWLNRGP